jgi:hypothetical protein
VSLLKSATGHITPMDQDTGTVGDIMSGFLGIGARITESGITVITVIVKGSWPSFSGIAVDGCSYRPQNVAA